MVSRRWLLRTISLLLPAAAAGPSLAGCTRSVEGPAPSSAGSSTPGGARIEVSPAGIRIESQPGVSETIRAQVPALVDAALSRVRSVWTMPVAAVGRSVTTPRSVQVTATRSQFRSLGGGSAPSVAATTRADGTVVLAPDVWTGTTREGRIVVLAHEFTHVLLHSQTSASARWLVEGPPEWTAYHDTSLTLPMIAPQLAAVVRAGHPATGPPTDAVFTDGPLQAAYQSAFVWCTFLVEHSRGETFTAFVIDATKQSPARLPSIFEAHFGSSIAALSGAYQEFQRTTFGAVRPSA